jgi:RNA ligase
MKIVKIKTIRKIESNSKRYDIQVIKNNNFIADNILVHNSLGIQFFYAPAYTWIIASRGSFISEQAVEAQKIFNTNISRYEMLNTSYTYIYEIIYPENRIVVNYFNNRDLILLSIINTETGVELKYNDIVCKYSKSFTIVKKYNIPKVNSLDEIKALEEENREGIVVRFSNGFRVKVKYLEYCRLHKILTNVSNVNVWEYLSSGEDFNDLLTRVPDEFYNWLKKTMHSIEHNYCLIEKNALIEFIDITYNNGIIERRDFAEKSNKSKYRSILFKLYDKKPYDYIIWKMVKPIWSSPFKDGYNANDEN